LARQDEDLAGEEFGPAGEPYFLLGKPPSHGASDAWEGTAGGGWKFAHGRSALNSVLRGESGRDALEELSRESFSRLRDGGD